MQALKQGVSVHFLVVLGYQAQLLYVAQSWMNMQFLLTKAEILEQMSL